MSAPCAGLWELFDSTDPADHREAAAICATCPLAQVRECRKTLERARKSAYGHVPTGTWAGKLYGRSKGSERDRIARENAIYDEREALAAHSAWNSGDRGAWAATGHRVWDRRYRARKRQEQAA